MRKILSAVLIASFLFVPFSTAVQAFALDSTTTSNMPNPVTPEIIEYVSDTVYAAVESLYDGDEIIVEDVNCVYRSEEYMEELAYNSRENIYFGYTLSDLNETFKGDKFVFTLGDDGKTAVERMVIIEDHLMEESAKNIAIGAGVIIVAVGLTVLTGGLAVPTAVQAFFTISVGALVKQTLISTVVSGALAGVVKAIETGDASEAARAAIAAGSEAFKWSAIAFTTGAITKNIFTHFKQGTPRLAEQRALNCYRGEEQASFINGEQVSGFKKGSTRPDVVRQINGITEAIEVKHYDLEANLNSLISKLKKQVAARISNLPEGSRQRIVLDVVGKNYSQPMLDEVVAKIKAACEQVGYMDIPVDIIFNSVACPL